MGRKWLRLVLVAGAVALLAGVASAQTNKGAAAGSPAAKPAVSAETAPSTAEATQAQQRRVVKTIFSYKKDLAMTDEQEKSMKDLLTGLQKDLIEKRAKLNVIEIELRQMLVDRAELKQIKTKLDESAALQASMRYADVETSRKIEGVLTAEQLKKWREIQAKERQALTGTRPAAN